MKKILFSLMAIVLVLGMVGAGAFAYFSDTEVSEENVFTAGTLDLELEKDDPVSIPMEFKNIKPGDNNIAVKGGEYAPEVIIRLDNLGTMDGIVSLDVKNLVNDDNGCGEPEASPPTNDVTCGGIGGELGANLEITLSYVYYDGTAGGVWAGETPEKPYLWRGTLDELADLDWSTLADTPLLWDDPECPGTGCGGAYLTIGWEVPEEVGNIIQSDIATFDMEFVLNQVH